MNHTGNRYVDDVLSSVQRQHDFFCNTVVKTVKMHSKHEFETNVRAAIIQLVHCSLEAKLVSE